jgi:phage/plasmid-like protein (TIGR03299 family)
MAHDLNVRNGRASMFYTGETPWHRLGTKLEKPATAEEAIMAAQLDYTVSKRNLFADIGGSALTPIADHFATVRTDTSEVLGVVGSRYCPIQNKDAFRFFDALVGEGEAIYHTAGALGKGERIWILAKLPDYIRVNGEDVVEKYLLLTNTHDGSGMVRAKLTPIRVVCSNTLSAALSGLEQEVHIPHTQNAVKRLEEAHKLLGLSNVVFSQLERIYQRMSLTKCSDSDLLAYVKRLIPDNPEVEDHKRTENIRANIIDAYTHVNQEARGSWWGAYNAVSEYTDHYISTKTNDDRMLKSIWFGAKERLKSRAFDLALDSMNKN